ncbi:MAG TPA: heparan-alpha-glucosaminide N-acetyltransferase domain-containing protein [Gemmatimonadaceae bacterium]|jgi:uncharacterized membrane protein|nr:heparan-alpha-glucosaminide N-acetyltransferase domain-containing protein [Gemmatimonadaceae bacterium]
MANVATASPTRRVVTIDAVRGLVMIIMALDHVRDFIHRAAMTSSPTDLASTTPVLFFTRWITHICAPTFMFTAGLGAFLWWQRGKTKKELSTFLLTRGLWLVLLELTVMRFAYYFNFSLKYPFLLLVLWVLGICMIGLSLLVWLPLRVLAVVSLSVIALHNLLDKVNAAQFGSTAGVWNLVHQVGAFRLDGATFIVGYPLVPWIAVMSLGFCFGPLFLGERAARRRHLVIVGSAMTLGFVLLRALNGYGDPAPWAPQRSPIFALLSFLNTTKYPPSLAFLLMTLGPMCLLLAWFDRPRFKESNPLVVFGRVPLFYFVAHFYAAHIAAVLLALVRYGSDALRFVLHPVPSMGGPRELFPPLFGYDLWVAYVVWAVIVVGLYPACRRFAGVKAKRNDWWVSYV